MVVNVFRMLRPYENISDETRHRLFSTSNDGFIETLNFLISEGKEKKKNPRYISEDSACGAPLHYAVYSNNVEAARILLANDADINGINNK